MANAPAGSTEHLLRAATTIGAGQPFQVSIKPAQRTFMLIGRGTGPQATAVIEVSNDDKTWRIALGAISIMTLALANLTASAAIGTAAATVDQYECIKIAQTTAGLTLSLPTPTAASTVRYVNIVNTGTASFTMHGVTVAASSVRTFIWAGSAWSLVDSPAGLSVTIADGFVAEAPWSFVRANIVALSTANGTGEYDVLMVSP